MTAKRVPKLDPVYDAQLALLIDVLDTERISQSELARRLGITSTYVNSVIRGRRRCRELERWVDVIDHEYGGEDKLTLQRKEAKT